MSPGVATPIWRSFLRAMADEIDSLNNAPARDALLRQTGRRMAMAHPLPPTERLEVLEIDANAALDELGWGRVAFKAAEQDQSLLIVHAGLPAIGGAGEPPGTWLAAALEGLYEGWLAGLPGADKTLVVRRMRVTAGEILLRYARP